MTEIDRTMANLCINDPSAACADKKAKFQAGGFVSSIRENLRIIEEYKRFPMKIQKYLTWKERYIAQVLCNVDTVQQITGGWLRDNGMRFRKWAELFALIKAVAAGWQPMLDIFADANKSCGVCRNERNNLQYWKFKLISSLIPQIPVLKFPKWPDIVLNLADVRFGINIMMPNYDIRISPVRLPELPKLAFGNISAVLALGALPIIPGIPPLPDLPDLPSLPRVKLPDLPPPPKLPKIAGQITGFLKIMKLISKMYCYYQKTTLIPEWQVGDIIAQRTERQGTMSFDFLSLNMPQFSLPTLKEIKVASHVNYSLRSDFITEYARASVKPINEFQTDLQRAIPTKVGEDVSVPGVNVNKSVKPGASIQSAQTASGILATLIDQFEKDQDVFLDTTEFTHLLRTQFVSAGLPEQALSLDRDIRLAHIEADAVVREATEFDGKKWELLKDYLRYEESHNAKLQKIIDVLRTDDVPEARQLVADTRSDASASDRALRKYQDFVSGDTSPIDTQNNTSSRDDEIA